MTRTFDPNDDPATGQLAAKRETTTDRQRGAWDRAPKRVATSPLVAVLAQLVECKLRHACPQIGACLERRR